MAQSRAKNRWKFNENFRYMKRIGILGDIGSGKSYIAKLFGYPVFNADTEVGQIYKKNKNVFKKLKKNLPLYFNTFPIKKNEVINAILDNEKNLKKIIKIVHLEVRKKMRFFLKKNHNKKIIILDIILNLLSDFLSSTRASIRFFRVLSSIYITY